MTRPSSQAAWERAQERLPGGPGYEEEPEPCPDCDDGGACWRCDYDPPAGDMGAP